MEHFEYIYRRYFVTLITKIQKSLSIGKEIHPVPEKIDSIINESSELNCAYRFLVILDEDMIDALGNNDKRYPFGGPVSNKTFFELIHPSYLMPYLIYASFAYELAKKAKTTRKELLALEYQIPLPLKFRNEKNYTWYLQKSRILTINENNQVIRHINTYHIQQPFMPAVDREIRFIGATVLHDEKINEEFQKALQTELTEYFKNKVFTKKEWELLKDRSDSTKLKEVKDSAKYKTNKEITKKVFNITCYRLKDIDAIIDYLRIINVL